MLLCLFVLTVFACFICLQASGLWMWSSWRLCMKRLTSCLSWLKQTHSPPVRWRKRKSRQGWSYSINCLSAHVFKLNCSYRAGVHKTHLFLGEQINLWYSLYLLLRLFLCRSGRRLSSMVSRYTSFQTVTLTKTRILSSRTLSSRWEPELPRSSSLLSFQILFYNLAFAGCCCQHCTLFTCAWVRGFCS